jgi:competence protein ComEC
VRFFTVFCIGFLIIAVRYLALPETQYKNGETLKITAALRSEPQRTGNLQKFDLMGIKIITWSYPEYHFSDRIEVLGMVKQQELVFPEITVLEGKKSSFGGFLLDWRTKFEAIYQKTLPEPQSSLLSGIVLGSKSNLPQDLYQALQKTGTMHIVVASGMNVTILASTMISFLLLFLSRRLAIILSCILIWFYVGLAGGGAPIVRAGFMGTLTFLALFLGREADAWRILGLTGFIMLFLDPRLLFDLGFQLSFMATFGIIFFNPLFNSWFKRIPTIIRNDLSQTLGAQIATLPIILLSFGGYAWVSPFVNLLIVSTLPVLMRLGLIGLVVPAILWLTYPLLTYIVKIVELFS